MGVSWFLELQSHEHGIDCAIRCQYQSLVEDGEVFWLALVVLVSLVQLELHLHEEPVVLVYIICAKAHLLGRLCLYLANDSLIHGRRHHVLLFERI